MSEPSTPLKNLVRNIPPTHQLLESEEFAPLFETYPRLRVVEELRSTLEDLRHRALEGSLDPQDLKFAALRERLEERLVHRSQRFYRRVINATGVILHTGLGRAPLAPEATQALTDLAPHPQRVEIDLASGARGGRDLGCAQLVEELVGCEAATVVNNNAAATILILSALARGKKVVISRGELVEIGGSYRIPDILRESGALLAEVGTTNRTHEKDYREALDDEVGMILKVHTSNYRVVGFTKEVEIDVLGEIGREHGIPVVHDLGSGCLVDLAARGRRGEHMVRDSIAAGADLVCFSGDKLLGGPQAGILAGSKTLIERCRKHPLFRALRPGRLVYTALEETLRLYLGGEEEAIRKIPVLRRLVTPAEELRPRALDLAHRLGNLPGLAAEAVECMSQTGSGSLPARDLPSWGVRLTPQGKSPAGKSPSRLAAELRTGEPAILTRLRDDALILDLRTLESEEVRAIEARLRALHQDLPLDP